MTRINGAFVDPKYDLPAGAAPGTYLEGTSPESWGTPAGGGGGGLTIENEQAASFTATAGSYWPIRKTSTPELTVTLPASPNDADRLVVHVVEMNPLTASQQRITFSSAKPFNNNEAIGRYDMWMTGDWALFIYNATYDMWFVARDYTRHVATVRRLTPWTFGNAWKFIDFNALTIDNAGIGASIGSTPITIKREGLYLISAYLKIDGTLANGYFSRFRVYKNGVDQIVWSSRNIESSSFGGPATVQSKVLPLAVGDNLSMQTLGSSSGSSLADNIYAPMLTAQEIW